MRLRRLFKTVVNRNERSRFEERKLCRTNLIKFLADHLTNQCERARYLALDLLCCAVPRLGNKTDTLLMPIIPKVIQCMQEAEYKDTKLKALHFFRTFFRHTNDMSSFIDQYIILGERTQNITSQVSFFHGTGIVFDEDIGDRLYSHLVSPLGKLMKEKSHPPLIIAIYRSLKKIHELIGDERFFHLLQPAGQEVCQVYMNIYRFESNDPYLSSSVHNLSLLVKEYLKKSTKLHFEKAFGMVDFTMLEKIASTKDCEQAVMINNLSLAITRAFCGETDIECHLMDLIKLVNALLSNSNRPVQISGFEILREIIFKVGFHLTPHLSTLVAVLRECLTSSNSKVKCKTEKTLNKLMRFIHPMTVIWELLSSNDDLQKESVLRFMLKELKAFPYYCFDLIALSKCIYFHVQDSNLIIQRAGHDCMIVLLSIMRATPVPGIRAEASKLIMHNYHLQRSTMQILREIEDQDEEMDSISDDGTTETTPSTAQSSMTTASYTSPPTVNSNISFHRCWAAEQNNFITPSHSEILTPSQHEQQKPLSQSKIFNISINKEKTVNGPYLHSTSDIRKSQQLQDTVLASPQQTCDTTAKDEGSFESASTFASYSSEKSMEQRDSLSKRLKNSEGNSSSCVSLRKREESEPELHSNYFHIGGGDWCEQPLESQEAFNDNVMEAGTLTLYSQTEENIGDIEPLKNSPSCQEEFLDPRKFNYNVMQVSTPKTMESIKEVDEDDEYLESDILLPTMISTPDGDSRSLISIVFTEAESTISNKSVVSSSHHLSATPKSAISNRNRKSKMKQRILDECEAAANPSETEHPKEENDSLRSGKEVANKVSKSSNFASRQKKARTKTTLLSEIKDIPEEVDPPFKKGKELPRTPIARISGAKKISFNPFSALKKQDQMPEEEEVSTKSLLSLKGKKPKRTSQNASEENCGRKLMTAKAKISQSVPEEIKMRKKSEERDHPTTIRSNFKCDGCPWQRDVEYASKGGICVWAEKFEDTVAAMKPFSSTEEADMEMRKAVDNLFGNSWKSKEEAMVTVIRLAKHHPEIVCENATKICNAVCNEVKNFRQSVAGKAILTCGHLYELIGKKLESKLRTVIAVLLAKSGNRTLASYFRLVIQSLFKIVMSTAPQKATLALIQDGSRHPNKASREIAAQFLIVLLERMGPLNTMPNSLAGQLLKCAALFVFDCSAITRYCGKRMFQLFKISPKFEKLKEQYLDVNTAENLSKVLEQIETKGVNDEILPINIIRDSSIVELKYF